MKLMTAEEASELLGVSPRAVMDLARAYVRGNPKGLPGVKVLREWRFTDLDIAEFVQANRTRPPEPKRKDRIAHRSLKHMN